MDSLRKSPSLWVYIGLAAAGVPFLISYANVNTFTVNGETVSSYRDWVAISCGAVAISCGVLALIIGLKHKLKPDLGLGALALALGGLQIVRGFGVLQPAPEGQTEITIRNLREIETIVEDPKTCPDKDICDNLAAKLKKTDPKAAFIATTRACDFGQKYDCEEVGTAWRDGTAGDKDPKKAAHYFDKACKLGEADSCNELAVLHANGDGAAKDMERAKTLFTKACDGGTLLGCKNMVSVLKDSDPKRALEFALRTCGDGRWNQGDEVAIGWACGYAGVMLLESKAKDDSPRVIKSFERACSLAPVHCHNLAVSFADGLAGQKRDDKIARELYTKACDAGNLDSCNNLGEWFKTGRGGPKDKAKAKELLEKACSGGDKMGCDNLKALK